MEKYEYAITVHKADEILATISDLSVEAEPPVVYCDYHCCGTGPKAHVFSTRLLTLTLRPSSRYSTRKGNKVGFWFKHHCCATIAAQAVQVALREQDMICFRHCCTTIAVQAAQVAA